jgi:23S rRNA pseudouridine2605 synthase
VADRDDSRGRRVQLHRAVSKLGWGSRTQAWDWVRAGSVRVDGRVVTDPLTWVDLDRQRITRAGEPPPPEPSKQHGCCVEGEGNFPSAPGVTLALHKPRGVVTTRCDERGRKTVYDLLPAGLPWVFPAGRLDSDSEGLLILTNDSRLANTLTGPEHHVPKTYAVTVSGRPAPEALDRLRRGIDLPGGRTRPAEVRLLRGGGRTSVLEVVLTEGRNRQVRRMLAAVGHKVRRLVRVAIGGYELGDLPPGACRLLDEEARRVLVGGGT